MSVLLRESESKSEAKAANRSGAEQGKTYEQLLFTLLAKNGFELSKNGVFKDGEFSIGRELNMMLDVKFDDIVFSYRGMDDTKNLVFVQVKHKQDESQMIDYKILSAEEWKAKGNLQESFNLQKYFISFLRIREELKDATSEELKDGKIQYVAIYTNIGLNEKNLDLKSNDDYDDSLNHIKSIFSFEKSPIGCYQLNSLSDELRSILEKSSDLHRIARELAQCVIWENYRKRNILGKEENAVNLYQVVLEREVIRKSTEKLYMEQEQYCVACFRDDFIDNEEPGSKKELRDAIFQAMIELAESETYISEDELKSILKKVEIQVTANFGKNKHKKTTLPCEWMTVKQSDIDDFLKCFVFLVKQPNVTHLRTLFHTDKDSILKGTHVGQAIVNTHPKFRERIEKELGFYEKASRKEIWLSGGKIFQYVQEQKEAVNISIMTSFYEGEVMKYGEFNHLGELEIILDSFLSYSMTKEEEEEKGEEVKERHLLLKESKVLSVCSEITLFSTIKILHFLNAKNYREENGYISIELSNLIEMRDRVEKAFSSETYKLLIIECRDKVNIESAEEICRSFSNIIESNRNKKIILINKQGEHNILAERFKFYLKKLFQNDCHPENVYVEETDDINLKDFAPVENPLEKKVIVFQGQEKKLSLAKLIGFKNWNSYVDYLAQDKILNKADIADIMIEVIDNDEIEVGSKPPETSSLEGAYAELFEKINKDTLLCNLLGNKDFENTTANKNLENDKLDDDIYALPTFFEEINLDSVAENLDNDVDEIYIFGGIGVSNRKEKVEKLDEYLGLNNRQESIDNMVGNIGSDSKIQIINDETDDDQFKDENFKKVCFNNPDKKIFWIHIQDKENANLQQFYNPNFYLQRKFKNVIITKEVIEELMKQNLSEIFIVYPVNNPEELIQSLNFTNIVTEQFLINYENGMILLCTQEDIKATFQEPNSLIGQNETVHCLKLEEDKLIWCYSYGSLDTLRKYIDCEQNEIDLVEEDHLVEDVKDRKVVIIADDPGMGKTTTLTKLYESKAASEPFIETHWILRINIKYHLQDIRDIKLVGDTINVVDFLSKIDLKLNQNVTKSLLKFALHKSKSFSKPLLLVFDGFDEIENIEDRNKMITLMKFLKNETAAKLWITTRLHYQEILENELSTFAFEFTPMDNTTKVEYIKNYLKNRLYLVLKSNIFAELFPNNGEMKENKRLRKYTKAFLSKIKSVFKENMFRFIGTPLQLYLMLEGSTRHFKIWTEKDLDENLDFDYLGNNILEIYETFIDRKFSIYFKKMGINESMPQEKDKYIFNQFIEDYAKSLILKSQPKYALEKFKDTVLSVGIIKSKGSNIEFIHTTFQDYFAAEVFMNWIKEASNIISNTSEREYILKEILKKPDFQLIRTFINLKLQIISEIGLLEESLKQYGKSIGRLLIQGQSAFIDEEGTALHIAVKERNRNIALFLLNCLKGQEDILKQLLFMRDKYGKTALHIACRGNCNKIVRILLDTAAGISEDILKQLLFMRDKYGKTTLHIACRGSYNKIFRILLDTAAGISEDTLQNFLSRLDENKWNALDEAVCNSKDARILEELLKRANNKLDLIMNKKKKKSCLILACDVRKNDFFKTLVNEFKHDDNSLKQLILFKDVSSSCNVLYYAALKFRSIVEYLLQMTRSINDNNETLKHLILPGEGNLPLKRVIEKGNIAAFSIILNAAKNIHDDNYTLKQLLWNCVSQVSSLLVAEEKKCGIMKKLLKTAANLGKEILEKFIFDLIKKDKNVMHVIFENGNGNVFTDSFKILEEVQYKIMREKLIEMYNSIPLTDELNVDKKRLIEAIRRNQISKVKDILDRAKNSSNNPKEKLKILLSDVNNKEFSGNTLHMACLYGRTNIIKELISYAIEINDEGETLNELIASRNSRKKTPFQVLRNRHAEKIKQIIESLILEATKDNNHQVANILQKMNKKKDR